ncbi:MAG: biopolymer transporter ExbD [Flavobacteriales bacterium]|nr:biopolymer transporter ExbD [Flavobacteriales bacterium]
MILKSKNKISTEFSMASMTDIVFLLLIFFMLTSSVISESALDVTLPKSEGKQTENESTIVEIASNGTYAVDGIIMPKEEIENTLKQKFTQVEKPSFIIKADQDSKNKELIYIMSIAHKNRYKVVVATQPAN